MDKIKILVIVVSVFLLLGASCQPTSLGGRRSTSRETGYSGTEGLSVSFNYYITSEEVWKDMLFNVGVDVQNNGWIEVKEGNVCFSSMPSNIFTNTDGCKDLGGILLGREDLTDGEIRDYTWKGYKLTQSYNEDSFYPLVADVCYIGETRASPMACIKAQGSRDSVCDDGEISVGTGGQGAPVQITYLKESIIPKDESSIDLRFSITMTNVGGGEIIDLDVLQTKENCNFDDAEEKNKAKITAELTGYGILEDCNEKIVNFGSSGEGSVVCNKKGITIKEGISFPLPLNIKLNYGYLSSTSGGFTIKKHIGEEV